MTRKAYFENFYEKFCKTLIGDNRGNGYHCFRTLVFDFGEA